jgi:hypothetical protein
MNDLLALRVLLRHIEASGELDVPGYLKSLNALCKFNGGLFKSDKQARFLWQVLKTFETPFARRWAASHGDHDANTYGCELVVVDERFGKSDPSKVRYYGAVFLLDGQGVKAAAKLKIQHPKAGETQATVASADPPYFVRDTAGPVLHDQMAIDRERDARARENMPMIEKIKALPDFERQEILQSFVEQLEAGKKLTPGQLVVVRKFMPVELTNDPDAWKRLYVDTLRDFDDKVMAPSLKVMQKWEPILGWYAGYSVEQFKDWEEVKRKPTVNGDVSRFGGNQIAQDLGWKKPNGVTGIVDILARLAQLAKGGNKAPRSAVKALRAIEDFVEWLKGQSAAKTEHFFDAQYAQWAQEAAAKKVV